MIKKILMFSILAGLAVQGFADQGTTAASFLKLQTGPRAIAMGESFAGLADDVNAINYNASGLAFQKDKEFTLMHAMWFQDIFYDNLAVSWPLEGIGSIGFNFLYLNAGSFDKYVIDPVTSAPVAQGQFSANSMAAGLTYARAIIPSLAGGLTIKMISETIDSSAASSVAVDLSAMWQTPIKGLSGGFNVMNLGPSLGFDQAFSLPINVRMGVGYKANDSVAIDCDYTQPIETAGVFSLGGEYGKHYNAAETALFIRLGMKYQGAVDYNQTQTGYGPSIASMLAMGIGLTVYKNYSFDYAYSNYGFLGTPHRMSLTVKFK